MQRRSHLKAIHQTLTPLLFLVFSFNFVSGQNISGARLLGPDEGLPTTENYYILEDDNENILVASDQGVFLIEGNDVTQYTTRDGLPDNTVFKLYKDPKGRIWAITYRGGVAYFDGVKWQTPAWNDEAVNIGINNSFIYHIHVTENDLVILDHLFTDNVLLYANVGDSVIHKVTPSILEDHTSTYTLNFFEGSKPSFSSSFTDVDYLFTHKDRTSITIYNEASLSTYWDTIILNGENIPFNTGPIRLTSNIFSIKTPIRENISNRFSDGSYLESIANTFWRIDKDGKGHFIKEFESGILYMTTIDSSVFLGLEKGGLWEYRLQPTGEIKFHTKYFSSYTVSHLFEDSKGALWVALPQHGLYKVDFPNHEIYSLPAGIDSIQIGLPVNFYNDTVRAISQRYYYRMQLPNDGTNELSVYDAQPITNARSHGVHFQHVDWFGKEGLAKVYEFDFQHGKPRFHMWLKDSIGNQRVRRTVLSNLRRSIVQGDYHYFASNGYAHRLNESEFDTIPSASPMFIEDLLIQNGKFKWAITNNGIARYEQDTIRECFSEYPFTKTRITSGIQGPNQWMVASTKEDGLLLFKEDTLFRITDTTFLPENSIQSIGADSHRVFVCTNSYLFIGWLNNDGFTKTRFLPLEWFEGLKKVDYFITNKEHLILQSGLTLYSIPNKEIENNNTSSEYRVVYNDETHRVTDDSSPMKIVLKRGDRSISFSLRSNESLLGENISWRWKTQPNDPWIYTNDGDISLRNLRAETYHLIVQYRNSSGQWSPEKETATFTIRQLYVETWWFWSIALSPILVLLFFTLMNSIRSRRLNRELIESNMSSLKMQINPHFIFNSFNSIQYLIRTNKNDTASEYLSRLAKLIRKTIERPNLHRITLEEELEYINEFISIEAMRLDHSFTFNLVIDDGIDVRTNYLPPMLLQPILENAVWHGMSTADGQGEITVRVESNEQELKIHIIDNGPGFPLEKWSKVLGNEELRGSLGLKNVVKRLELLTEMYEKSYKLELLNSEKGTHFVLTLAL